MEWIDIEEEGNPKKSNEDYVILYEDRYEFGDFNPKNKIWRVCLYGNWCSVSHPIRFYFEIPEPEL
jgi:hypothetical protein